MSEALLCERGTPVGCRPVSELAGNGAGSRAGRHGLFALKPRQVLVVIAIWIERLFGPHPSDLRFGVKGCGLRVVG